ncbi:DUF4011 domain-containing protein [Brevibacillus sp. SYP-B805]|nr:DUF4011 domain-containing protein [Brevibacillus sp. SYP-B805]
MKELLIRYRDRLTDITARNKSLRLLRLTNKNHFDLQSLQSIDDEAPSRVLREIFSVKPTVALLPCNTFDEEGVLLNRRLTQLKREIDLIEQETGMNTFHIAFGFLEGFLVEDLFLRCPLLFFPARLSKTNINKNPYWVLELEEETQPFINRTFSLAANKYLGIQIGNEIDDEFNELTPENALLKLQSLLKRYNLQVQIDHDDRTLLPFPSLKREDIPKEKGYILKPYCVIGKFQQSSSTLLKDYELLLDNPPTEGLLYDLFHSKEESDETEIKTDVLNDVEEAETFFVLDTDASQEAAVIASRNSKGLIVHGPPGTGKSQVIVNLIADRLARNEKVLLVCQKPVALDVVYNRLSSIQLHKHVALVHDFNTSKSSVYQKIASVLERQGNRIAGDHVKLSQEMQALAQKLNQIAESLHKPRPFGKTLYYLYTHAKWDPELLISVEDLLNEVTFEALQSHLIDLRNVIELMQKYDHWDYPWSRRKSFSTFHVHHHLELQTLLQSIVTDVKTGYQIRNQQDLMYSPEVFVRNKESVFGLEEALRILQNRNIYKHILLFYRDENRELENEEHLDHVKQTYGYIKREIDMLSGKLEPVTHLTFEEAQNWSSKIKQFLDLNQKFSKFINANWYTLRKELQAHCQTHKVSFDGTSIRQYLERIDSFIAFEKLRDRVAKVHFFSDVPVTNDFSQWEKWINQKNRAIEFLELFVVAQTTFPAWLQAPQAEEDLSKLLEKHTENQISAIKCIIGITERLRESMTRLSTFISDDQVNEWTDQLHNGIYDVPKFEALQETIEHFDSLCRLDQMKDAMGDLQRKLITRCLEKAPIEKTKNLVDHWTMLIENSFLHAWILHVEKEEPHIQEVSTEIFQNNVSRYKTLHKLKREAVPGLIDGLLADQAVKVPSPVKRQLKTEAGRKRKQASLRQIAGTFTEDLLNLIPCWLCTPEAVSAIFPGAEGLFDLVIFDEASQCPVENAIPAIFRAKQVVVAGDEKQLPPASFFQKVMDDGDSVDDEDEENDVLYKDQTNVVAKSLLEWCKPRFPDIWLTGHYRSKHEELINFSNYAFYGKRMQIAPRVIHDHSAKPFEFVQVNGQWINNQNRIEAEKIVDLVYDILKHDQTHPTLGIITFNSAQAELINDVFEQRAQQNPELQLLWEQAKQRKNGEENVGLFVKNIENVQGDERDIILFSVAYAKDQEGKMVSQFGPLGGDAGENRLNVAITRAKQKVFVVCSFDPAEWTRVETYKSRGVRLLKRYLEYAKAISEGNHDYMVSILNGLLEGTSVNPELDNQIIYDSIFEQQVREELVKRGFTVHTQVGFSGYRIDLGVIHPDWPDQYILGIECDGAMYHSSKVARERDIYRQRFLESNGWKIHRIWSRNWWKARDKEIEKIVNRVEALRAFRVGIQ